MKYFCFFITTVFLLINTLMINTLNKVSKEVTVIDFYGGPWIADTIDFSPARVFLSVPESSLRHSREQIFEGHGKSIYYPLKYTLDSEGIWNPQVIFIEHIVTTSHDRLINKDSIDMELWNTFNSGSRGSRSYICNGLYSRIDILEGGIAVFYEDLTPQMAEIANQIINSIAISSDRKNPVFKQRKKVPTIKK